MSNQPWHADADLIGAYARGQLDAVAEASVETHVTRCPSCRAVATDVVAASATTTGSVRPRRSGTPSPPASPHPAPDRWAGRSGDWG